MFLPRIRLAFILRWIRILMLITRLGRYLVIMKMGHYIFMTRIIVIIGIGEIISIIIFLTRWVKRDNPDEWIQYLHRWIWNGISGVDWNINCIYPIRIVIRWRKVGQRIILIMWLMSEVIIWIFMKHTYLRKEIKQRIKSRMIQKSRQVVFMIKTHHSQIPIQCKIHWNLITW